ncbi:MAG: hypothetical protein AEth_01164 [Candidatus Argoarchaeum ethanivorans]|uniref:Tetratricopeptide repeat protein n=1 Tax=Candidatus Argoarchaeum ethanivorans TaxID=2608793 RepID=A0A8B3S2F7_9EURY|nr:MAG: hypothetical protein AEth_01164 [Candidatus Argoarchaeum ethanivorans]
MGLKGRTARDWFDEGYEAKDPKKKVEYYTKALEIDPKDVIAWYFKGIALRKLGRCEEEIRCYDKALEINPEYVYVWNNKGIALRKLKRYEEAIGCYDKALDIDPKYERAKKNRKIAEVKLREQKEKEQREEKIERERMTSDFVSSIESEISRIKSSGVKISKSIELIKQVKSELNKNNFERAKELAEEAKKIASERKSGYNLAFKSISESERILNKTKNKGVIISTDLLLKSKQALDTGDYEESVRSAEELKNLVNNRETKYRKAREWIKSAESAIRKSKDFGCDTSKADELLNRAKSGFGTGNYEKSVSDVRRSEEVAKEIKERSKRDQSRK